MSLFDRSKSKQRDARRLAKADYETAADPEATGHHLRRLRARVAQRCRAHIDKTFIDGAERTAVYEDAVLAAIAAGSERPEQPKARLFQSVPAFDHEVIAYLPEAYAERVFDVGRRYQRMDVDAATAIKMVQGIAEEICYDLQVVSPFTALQFLRDQLAEETGEGDEDASEDTANTPGCSGRRPTTMTG